MVNSTLYTIHLDGSIMRRSVNDGVFGPGTAIDMWSNNILADAPSITGMFYDPQTSRVYYTMSGQNSLFYREFLPESGILHAERSVALGAVAALAPSRVRGMFLGNGQLWFGDATTGNLLSMPFAAGQPQGTATVGRQRIRLAFTSAVPLDRCSAQRRSGTDVRLHLQRQRVRLRLDGLNRHRRIDRLLRLGVRRRGSPAPAPRLPPVPAAGTYTVT